MTGPAPVRLRSTPIAATGSMMSANITAPSTPYASTGIRLTSAHSSGVRAITSTE
jgi:hypothetical protein